MATYWENSCSFGLRYVSWCKYLIVSLVFSHLDFWSGILFLIAPLPDLCLLVPCCERATHLALHYIHVYESQIKRLIMFSLFFSERSTVIIPEVMAVTLSNEKKHH